MYSIKTHVVGSYQANCYILESAGELLVIDPGAEATRLVKELEKLVAGGKRKISAIVSTHGHCDHIGAVNEIRDTFKVPFYLHEQDQIMAATPELSGFIDEGSNYCVNQVDWALKENDQIEFGDNGLTIWHTPGHTPGSVCLVDENNQLMFSGDMLFAGSVGRTDFPLGDRRQLNQSCQRLAKVKKDYQVYPGHGPKTRLRQEQQINPFLLAART